jgi:hypothetical protein
MKFGRCAECGEEGHPWWDHETGYKQYSGETSYPYVTTHITGKPIEVTGPGHERELCRIHGVRKRDDAAWVEKRYLGVDPRTGKQRYSEGSGMGLPGVWY